jgi:hypothetical protein
MRKDTFHIRLFGAAAALAFGTSMAQSGLIAPGAGQGVADVAIPVVDTKAGINAGGIAGAGVSVGGSGVGISAGVQDKSAKVSAGVAVGSKGGQVGATVDTGAAKGDASVNAATNGGAKVGTEATAAASGADVSVDADVKASAG